MINSFALVRNLKSSAEVLQFAEFKLVKVGASFSYDLKRAQNLFPKEWPLWEDWIYEKDYEDDDDEVIPFELEDTLLLLRLFKAGDLFFVAPCKEYEDGSRVTQVPYPAMTYAHSSHVYAIESEECSAFDKFSSMLVSGANWASNWFNVARRFFLYGGGKEYNPLQNLADRVVDYMVALEAVLVPEKGDFIGRRLRERASSLLGHRACDGHFIMRLLKDFYDVRSAIVHGTDVSRFRDGILTRNFDFEVVVREIMVEALRSSPTGESDRLVYLKGLFDVSDQMRAKKLYNDFGSIKDSGEKRKCFERMSRKSA